MIIIVFSFNRRIELIYCVWIVNNLVFCLGSIICKIFVISIDVVKIIVL